MSGVYFLVSIFRVGLCSSPFSSLERRGEEKGKEKERGDANFGFLPETFGNGADCRGEKEGGEANSRKMLSAGSYVTLSEPYWR